MALKLIGLTGVARSGKDSFFKLVEYKFPERKVVRLALADALKADIDSFLKQKVGISAFTSFDDEKTFIRPMLVAYGKIMRLKTMGRYWVDKLQPRLDEELGKDSLVVVTDIRYDIYPKDEVHWLREQNGGYLVHISRISPDGSIVPPPNEDEAYNDEKIRKKANYLLSWPTRPDILSLMPFLDFLDVL